MSKPKPLRQTMPVTAAFIDEMREVFGAEMVNEQIRLGMQGAQTFHAVENGQEVGTKFKEPTRFVDGHQMVLHPSIKTDKEKR